MDSGSRKAAGSRTSTVSFLEGVAAASKLKAVLFVLLVSLGGSISPYSDIEKQNRMMLIAIFVFRSQVTVEEPIF